MVTTKEAQKPTEPLQCSIAVIWIDWYPYHLARFGGLQAATPGNEAAGIELVGGVGVHAGLKFREERDTDLRIETLRPDSNWHNVNKLGLSISLVKALSRLNPEVVLIPGYYTLPAFAAMLWSRWKKRTSVLMTETTATDHLRIAWKEKIKSRLIRGMFDWAVTGGAAHVRYLRHLGFPADRIAHFYDVVGNDRIQQSTEALRERSSAGSHNLPEKYFLFVGRLAEEKNVDGLLLAWLEYRKRGGTWSLVLAGEGAERERIQARLEDSPYRGEVVLTGHKSSRELIPLFAFAGCFVLPSTREPWGLVVNEAMAASLPLIVSRHCGCAEDLVRNGENGFVFDPSDSEALVTCLLETDRLPSEKLERRGFSSAQRIAQYSPQGFGAEIVRIADWAYARRRGGLPHQMRKASRLYSPAKERVPASAKMRERTR